MERFKLESEVPPTYPKYPPMSPEVAPVLSVLIILRFEPDFIARLEIVVLLDKDPTIPPTHSAEGNEIFILPSIKTFDN